MKEEEKNDEPKESSDERKSEMKSNFLEVKFEICSCCGLRNQEFHPYD